MIQQVLENQFFKKYQIYLIPIIGLIITALLLIFFIIPQINGLSTVNDNIQQITQQKILLSKKTDDLNKVNLESTKEQYQLSLAALPADKNIPSAIAQLQRLSSLNSLQLANLSLGQGGPASGVDSFIIKTEVLGSLDSISNFLNDIKEGPRVMKVSSIEINGGQGGIFSASLGISVYYQAQQNILGKIDDPVVLISDSEKSLLENIRNLVQENLDNFSATTVVKGKIDPFE